MKNKQQILKQKYRDELADSYIRGLIRGKGVMNYQITQKMIDDKRASVRLEREKEEFDKWKHFEYGQEPKIFQGCLFASKETHCVFYGYYQGNKLFKTNSISNIVEATAWQPAPIYKP